MPQGLVELCNRTANRKGEQTVLDLINDWHINISFFGRPSMKSCLGFTPSLPVLILFKKVFLAILDNVSAHAWTPSLRNSGDMYYLFVAQDDSMLMFSTALLLVQSPSKTWHRCNYPCPFSQSLEKKFKSKLALIKT